MCIALALLLCFSAGLPAFASETVPAGDPAPSQEGETQATSEPPEEPTEPPEGTVPPEDLFCGDANGDGLITVEDARLVLRAAVGLDSVPDALFPAADYDHDGTVTVGDARRALRAAIGLEPFVRSGEYVPPEPVQEPEPPKDPLNALANAVSFENLSASMKWLVETVGVRSWWDTTQNAAADLLAAKLQQNGFAAAEVYKCAFEKDGVTGYNVMAIIPTAAANPDIYVFSAHYDTARYTGGAVDNASGTALLLELARVLNAARTDFGAQVRFVFTAGEEQGFYGAYAYLDGLSAAEYNRHRFFFNIDMAGRPVDGKYYLSVSTQPSYTYAYPSPAAAANLGSLALDAAYAALGVPAADGYYSPVRAGYHDIIPFCKAGFPALTLSWRCIDPESEGSGDYGLASPPMIHTQSDNIANFNMDSLYQTARLAAWAAGKILSS